MTPAVRLAFAAAARAARAWALWLALALAAAHSVAAWHAYTHPVGAPERGSGKAAHTAADTCALCLAAAGLDGPPATPPAWQFASLPPATADTAVAPRAPQAPVARPYAIRAPPLSS